VGTLMQNYWRGGMRRHFGGICTVFRGILHYLINMYVDLAGYAELRYRCAVKYVQYLRGYVDHVGDN